MIFDSGAFLQISGLLLGVWVTGWIIGSFKAATKKTLELIE